MKNKDNNNIVDILCFNYFNLFYNKLKKFNIYLYLLK